MSSTNHTTNYNLPQFESTDKPAWLGDINPAFSTIDAQMKLNADAASSAATAADTASDLAGSASTEAAQAKNDAATALSTANTATTTAESAQSTASTANQTATSAATTANAAAANINEVMSKLLMFGNPQVETFTVNSSNNKQLVGSRGHTINITSDPQGSGAYFSSTNLVIAHIPDGETKIMGFIEIKQNALSGSAQIPISGTILENSFTRNLSSHGTFTCYSTTDGHNPIISGFNIGLHIANGIMSDSLYTPSGTRGTIISYNDSIITKALM